VEVISSKTSKPNIFEQTNIFPKSDGINEVKPIVIFFILGGISFNEAQCLTAF